MKIKFYLLIIIVIMIAAAACQKKEETITNEPQIEDTNTGGQPEEDENQELQEDENQEIQEDENQEIKEDVEDQDISESFLDSFSDDLLKQYFGSYKNAAFVLSDGKEQRIYNQELANHPISPYSTFKIPNSLIGLETGVITKEDSKKKWDGTINSREEINQDLTLETAFEYSAVWYYKLLAKDIGAENMKKYLNIMSYGNQDVLGGIDTFWLQSTLKITPMEQVKFIESFYNNDFQFSDDTVLTVKSIMKYKDTDLDLYGKTGSSGDGDGWYVGYIIVKETPYYFAAYIDDNINGPAVRELLADMYQEAIDNQGL